MKPGAWALRHPVPLGVVTAGAALFGLLALFSMNIEFVPTMVLPSVSVVSLWPGVGAEIVEEEVTAVLEDRFTTLPGLTDMRSESREGVSIIRLQFTDDIDLDAVLQDVRNQVDLTSADLPADLLGRPAVDTWGAADLPVVSFTVSAGWNPARLTSYINRELVPALYRIDGVGRVEALGTREPEIAVTFDPEALAAVNIAPLELFGAISSRDASVPAGVVDWSGGSWALRVSGQYTNLEELRSQIIGGGPGGPIRVGDVADVGPGFEPRREIIRTDGTDLVVIQVTKRETGNAMRISRDVRKMLDSLAGQDAALDFRIIHDDSEIVYLALRTVISSAFAGILMAVAVIWLFFRNWRWTLIIAASLPTTLVLAFAGMRLAGQTINVLTMAGITVSLGMIVDASIVILENIHRTFEENPDPLFAAREGSSRVSGAVFASVTTSVSVFAPMMFMSGIIGIVMKDLALSLLFTLAASLFAALFLVPPMTARGIALTASVTPRPRKPGRQERPGLIRRLEASYGKVLDRTLDIRGAVVFAAVAILVSSVLAAALMGVSFIPAAEYGEVFISMELPPGSTLEEGTAVSDRAGSMIRREVPGLSDLVFFIGMDDDLSGDARRREAIWCQILLSDSRDGHDGFRQVIDRLNETLPPALPGVTVSVFNGGFDRMVSLATEGSGYRVELSSESWDRLQAGADRVETILSRDPDVLGVRRDVVSDRRTLTTLLDGEALGSLGIDATGAAMTMRMAFDGMEAGDFRPERDEVLPVRVFSSSADTTPDSSTLGGLRVRSAAGMLVSLDAVSRTREGLGISGIRRHNRARTLTLVAQTRDENIRDIGRRLTAALEREPLDGVDWRLEGVSGLIGDSVAKLGIVLVVSLFLVYAVMAIQFEQVVQPLIIMASVPFCFIGVVGGLAAFGSDISVIAFVGIVALAGIVVNNAIVQVDRINYLRKQGMALRPAVISGSVSRLRPIMMTTLTTFFGALPMALARGGGARVYAPLGQAIAGGLLSSTLVTLFLVPVLYMLTEYRRENARKA